jgi:hypothetical protein
MIISESLVERRCYTSVSWVNKEKPEMRTKVQDLISTAKVERTYQILTLHTSKSIALIRTDAAHRKIRRKISNLQC